MFKNQDLSLFNKGTYKEIDRIYISRVQNAMFKVMELQEEYGKYDNDSFLNEMKDSMVGMYLGYDFVNTDKHGFDAKRKNYEYDEWLEVKQVSFKSESWQATFNDTTIEKAEAFKDIKLIKTGGSHGTVEMYAEDWFTEISGDAMGIIFQAEGEKTVYFVGDTIWTADVNKALNRFKPEIIVMNTGAARVLAFKEAIIMGKEDVEHMVKAMPNSQIVAVHLDSVNHATVTRKDLREFIKAKNIGKNIIVPEDGEIIKF